MVAVIGDIHGCFYTFEALYNKIQKQYPGIDVYCVGDLVDRGLHSYEVMKFFIDAGIRFTPGNHDYMFYSFVKEPDSLFARSWVFNGNESTLRSYLEHLDSIAEHIAFIKSSPLFYDLSDCFISHAGISERYAPAVMEIMHSGTQQELYRFIEAEYENESGVLWTRERLMNMGKIQVVGHTNQREVKFDSRSNSIYVDTGAFLGRKLSAVIVDNNEVIEVLAEATHTEDID